LDNCWHIGYLHSCPSHVEERREDDVVEGKQARARRIVLYRINDVRVFPSAEVALGEGAEEGRDDEESTKNVPRSSSSNRGVELVW
jgi:hypothetical protein